MEEYPENEDTSFEERAHNLTIFKAAGRIAESAIGLSPRPARSEKPKVVDSKEGRAALLEATGSFLSRIDGVLTGTVNT